MVTVPKMKVLPIFILFSVLSTVLSRRTAEEWRTRKIYQILTDRFAGEGSDTWDACGDLRGYCNGNFRGLIEHLDYIIGMGFNAIWISPVPEHVEGDYHGYSATDFYSVSHHWGTEQDFHDLIEEAHARDVWIMIDVVPNHMGIDVYGETPSEWFPFNETQHYHPFCEILDWNDPWQVENCWIFGLPDLDQTNQYVRDGLCHWIDWILTTFDIDGMRIDTVKHINHEYWWDFAECSGDVYEVGEVYDGRVDVVLSYMPPLDAVLNYPYYYDGLNVFSGGSMYTLRNKYLEMKTALGDALHIQGNFLDNHDRPRFLCDNPSQKKLQNFLVLTLTMEGIPILYYGTEQAYSGCNDPLNRESLYPNFNTEHNLYQMTATTNNYMTALGDDFLYSDQVERWIDDQMFAFTRGQALVITTNIGELSDLSRTISYHNYEIGTVLVNIFWPDVDRVTVTENGISVVLLAGEPKIYIPEDIYVTL